MGESTPPDALVLRGALITGCSFWKPILLPVCQAVDGGRLGEEAYEESEEDTAKRPAARIDEPGETAAPCDSNGV